MALTPAQQTAVECDKNLIIFAGPGSGKTSTSIAKAARILRDRARRLILCTFTVEAAGELSSRLTASFAQSGEQYPFDRVRVGTFDSLALWHLKQQGLMKMRLLSPKAQMPRLRQIVKDKCLPPIDELMPWFEKYQSTLDRATLIADVRRQEPDAEVLITAYYEWLKAGAMMDLATVKRTCAEGMAAGRIALFPCTDMLVDESQDSDELQMLMARTMGSNGVTTTLVGDDDQTIYDFRNATGYAGMKAFADECHAEIVRLGENFRSHSEIVESAVRLIAFNNPNRVDKHQIAVKGPGGTVEALSFESPQHECEWVAEDIKDNEGALLDCAVIARRNRVLDIAQSALTAKGIPHHRAGTSLWDREDIASYLGFLGFLVSGAAEGLSMALGFIGFGSSTINQLMISIRENKDLMKGGGLPIVESASPEEVALLKSMSNHCIRWRKAMRDGELMLLIGESAEEYVKWAKKFDPGKNPDEDSSRIKRLREGLEYAVSALECLRGKLSERLRAMQDSKRKDPEPGVVRLMTMHSSKGLEFDRVYLVDCAERESEVMESTAPSERRIFYVGMTRAKKHLRLSYGGPLPQFLLEAGFTL